MGRIAGWLVRSRRLLLGSGLVTVPIVCAGIGQLRIDTDLMSFLPEDSGVRRANAILAERYGALDQFFIVVDSGERDGAIQPDFLRRLAAFSHRLQRQRYISSVVGPHDWIEETRAALGSDAAIAESAAATAQIVFLLAGEPGLGQTLDLERRRARLSVWTSAPSVRDKIAVYERANTLGIEAMAPGVAVATLGTTVVYAHGLDTLLDAQVRSLLIAAGAISVMMMLSLGGVLGLIAMVPNVLPVCMLFGCMGWLGIPLNSITILMGCTALGLAVDDTAHFMVRLRDECEAARLRSGDRWVNQSDAVERTLAAVLWPMLSTSLSLLAAFCVLLWSGFVPLTYLGALSALTMVLCLVADVVVLPALTTTVPLWLNARRSAPAD